MFNYFPRTNRLTLSGVELARAGMEVIAMSIFETMGLVWVVLTPSLATVGLFYLAYVGLKALLKKEVELPREVKEMFRIAK